MWKINRWEISPSGNMATLFSNGQEQLTVEVTDEIKWAVKMQKEATIFLEAFKKVKIDDSNIIGYLNVLLDDYINFLDSNSVIFLIEKMEQITTTTQIDINNATSINALLTNLKVGNIDAFYEALEQFQIYNENYLSNAYNNENSNGIIKH